ncbi:hypothetical protein QL995_07385 [Pseudoalteromonas sp. APC 3358]|uniref:hypothetical protein n=1 Tax=Pseudoalteromonas sp. APC 3358 TaxID=3035176 RepID=UPI0025B52246|nr:hypothetical protein [Pseudoalteromonas sp. APC 3358]MDN3382493.1 hypothetical protein [Pseudoalteromonas sp. APC 3358]
MRQTFVVLIIVFLSSCSSYKEVPSFDAYAMEIAPGKYEIKTSYTSSYRGNLHAPFDLRKHVNSHDTYFSVPKIEGVVFFSEIDMFEKTEILGILYQSDLKGKIEFKGNKMVLMLKLPRYEGSSSIPTRWEPYRFNGEYSLQKLANKSLKQDK